MVSGAGSHADTTKEPNMTTRYSVRALGCSSWSDVATIRQARKDRATARAAGIAAVIVDNRTNTIVD
jgi:hypothetical protein